MINKCQHMKICVQVAYFPSTSVTVPRSALNCFIYSSSSAPHRLLSSLHTLEGDCMRRDIRTGGIFPGMFPHCYIFYHYLGNYSDPQNSTFLLFNPLSLGYFATATLGD